MRLSLNLALILIVFTQQMAWGQSTPSAVFRSYVQSRESMRLRFKTVCGSNEYPSPSAFPSLSKFNPPKVTNGGFELPRNQLLQYRGIDFKNPQMDAARFIRAALGDGSVFTFTKGSSEFLLGDEQKFSSLAKSLSSRFSKCGDKIVRVWNRLSPNEKSVLVADFLTALEEEMPTAARRTSITVGAPGYIEWPSDIVFTTVYPQVANQYGGNIMIFQDSASRGLDMIYFNYGSNPVYRGPDNGEHVFARFMTPEELVGFQIMSYDWNGDVYTPADQVRYKTVVTGLYKLYTPVDHQPYVVIVDGNHETCFRSDDQVTLRICDTHNYQEIGLSPLPAIKEGKPKAIAFISASKLPDSVYHQFDSSAIPLREDQLKAWAPAIQAMNATLTDPAKQKITFEPVALEKYNWELGIHILEATIRTSESGIAGNATQQVSEWCELKSECKYKISKKYLGELLSEKKPHSFEVTFTCGSSLTPKRVLIEADAENQIATLSCQ